jgi:polyisoprenyl-phosphate glycosyltransferase
MADSSNEVNAPCSGPEVAVAPVLSIIVPCANEEEVLGETHRRLSGVLAQIGLPYEILYVDDGSTDSTLSLLKGLQSSDPRVRVVSFSRNFGHQIAITAGIEYAAGNALVVIDADLQDPPEVIAQFVERWRAGYEVVYGVRTERLGESAFKRWSAGLFYRLMGKLSDINIPLDAGDFRLLDRKVAAALLAMPERDRYIRGMVSWLGFSQAAVPYQRSARQAGTTKYSLSKMIRFAADGILSFSTVPLKFATWLGFAVSALSAAGILVMLVDRFIGKNRGDLWAILVIAILFLGGVQLICLGILGAYVGRIYGESKRRPIYLVRELLGFDHNSDRVRSQPVTRKSPITRTV